MSDQAINWVGNWVRVERTDDQVHLIFTADSIAAADDLAGAVLEQMKSGALRITLGPPGDR